jgi:spore coat protein U-like protein
VRFLTRSLGAAVVVVMSLVGAVAPALGAGQCRFVTVSGVAFGTYDTSATSPLDSTGSVSLECNPGTAGGIVTVTLSTGSSGSFTMRHMLSGSTQLDYNLFLDAARTTVWGDGSGGSSLFTAQLAPKGWTTVTQPIYGRIPAQQNVPPGVYGDAIIVTMNW